MLDEPIYTVNEGAEKLRLSSWTLWDLLKKGRLKRTKIAGKTFIRESELRKLIVDQVNKPREARRVHKQPAVAPAR